MAKSAYFNQECPICGRRLQISVEHLGRVVECRHCHGKLMATDRATAANSEFTTNVDLLRRVDELLAAAAVLRQKSACQIEIG